jgi:uncharacterized protein (TIGR03382 family)
VLGPRRLPAFFRFALPIYGSDKAPNIHTSVSLLMRPPLALAVGGFLFALQFRRRHGRTCLVAPEDSIARLEAKVKVSK